MSHPKRISHIYNPHNQSRQELLDNFVIRQSIFKKLFPAIRNSTMETVEQSFLIQGQRGTGKTTLLLKLEYEIQNDPEVSKWLIPVRLNEEQYNIFSLCRLWETVADHLEEHEGFSGLAEMFERHFEEDDYPDMCYRFLEKRLQQEGKKLLLLIDNIADLLGKLTPKECSKLRDILHKTTEIRIIAASARTLEQNFHYDKPFYEFFKTIYLEGLSQEETETLLLQMAKHYEEPKVRKIVETQKGRVESLRRLTGGIPRTIILLFEIFADASGDVFEDLEMVLDRITPLYKHRMDDLSAQQQAIMDVIALHWDAVATYEIAKKLRMQSKAVSSQLKQLEKNSLISSVSVDGKNKFYLVSERFFNIWYLMRYGRRQSRSQVLWLTRFFQEWCSAEEIQQRAGRHIEMAKRKAMHSRGAYFMCEAMAPLVSDRSLQHQLINSTREFLQGVEPELASRLSSSDQELFSKALDCFNEGDPKTAVNTLLLIKDKDRTVLFILANLYWTEFKDFAKAEEYYKQAIDRGNARAMNNLAYLYQTEFKDFAKAEEYYKQAIDRGNARAMNSLAYLYQTEFKDFAKAEEYYNQAIDQGHAGAMYNLALLYELEFKDLTKAEEYYKQAIDRGNADAMNNLAAFYHNEFKNFSKAEEYYKQAIDQGHAIAMCNLANLYQLEFKDFVKAEEYYKQAIDRGHVGAMNGLSWMYFSNNEKKSEAFELARQAVCRDNDATNTHTLATVLLWNNQFAESIQVFKECLALEPYEKFNQDIINYLIFLLAKRQYHLLLQLFKETRFNLRERYRPIYYAMMHKLQDEYPKELKRMGEELKETVEEILLEVEKMAGKYDN